VPVGGADTLSGRVVDGEVYRVKQSRFDELARAGYRRIPLMTEVFADLDTPLSTYLKLADRPFSYLFESVHGGEKWGRYSIIGLPCRTVIRVSGHTVSVTTDRQEVLSQTVADPLAWIDQRWQAYRVPQLAGFPRFTGGLVGYFGYDTIRYIESKLTPCVKTDPLQTPDILLLESEEVVVFDNLRGKLFVVVHVDPREPQALSAGRRRLDEIVDQLRNTSLRYPAVEQNYRIAEEDFLPSFDQQEFEQAVARIKDYIVAGDVMQVVLSQRMTVPFDARPVQLYRALRSLNPSPYMFFLNLDDFCVVGSSPEILVRLDNGTVTVRPIAGTRRRGRSEAEDRRLERELLADPKERAEHLMLIDLGRNDIGRVARVGTVKVTETMSIERYSHVMHIVSNVAGELRSGLTPMDVLRATFPAGTVSGAPKIRAMEIIDELEPLKRGVYSGAVGYLGWGGNMDTAIAIRTAVIKDGTLHLQAGAGIVADSIPSLEWKETMNKGRAVFRAAALAVGGMDDESAHH